MSDNDDDDYDDDDDDLICNFVSAVTLHSQRNYWDWSAHLHEERTRGIDSRGFGSADCSIVGVAKSGSGHNRSDTALRARSVTESLQSDSQKTSSVSANSVMFQSPPNFNH